MSGTLSIPFREGVGRSAIMRAAENGFAIEFVGPIAHMVKLSALPRACWQSRMRLR